MNREMPIIADDYVDTEFGTGAVKITPAHDPNDYEMGLRQHLDTIVVIGKDGKMTAESGKYAGMDRDECRAAIIQDMKDLGLLVKVEDCPHAVGHCQRCGHPIEALVSTQWFVKMAPLLDAAKACVEDGRTKFVPERFTKNYLGWMENMHDWCISRQIWWGHRIPVWYCDDCGAEIASRTDIDTCPKCGGKHIHQDEDALDTWFSSALWPFSIMGWPDTKDNEVLKQFYPTSVLVTGYDIIFFWVARMLIMGMEFMKDIPFERSLSTASSATTRAARCPSPWATASIPCRSSTNTAAIPCVSCSLRATRRATTCASTGAVSKRRATSPTRSGTPPGSPS